MDQVRRVLIVEDNPGDVRLIMEMLRESGGGVTAESVDTLASAIERLATADIDVALLDLGLPDSQGLETFARLRDAAPGVALVVLTGNSDVELAIRAVREGAQDFLVKGKVDGDVLTRAMAYALGRQQSDDAMTQEKALLARAEEIARLGSWRYDLTTGEMWWSDEMHRIFGLDPDNPPEDLVAASEAVAHPEDRGRMSTMIQAVIADGTARSAQYRILLPDGTLRWIAAHSQQECDARGAVVAITGFAQDITETKLAEEAIVRDAALDRAVASLSAAMVAAKPSLEELAELVLANAKELTGSTRGFISLCDPSASQSGDCASTGGASAVDADRVREFDAMSAYNHPWKWLSKAGDAFYANSPASVPALDGTPEGHTPITSLLSAPAIAEGRFVGQIAVGNAPGGYTDEDLATVQRLTALFAIAVIGQEERAALLASDSNLRQSNVRFERMVYGVAEAMGRIVEVRDPYTQGHEVRVAGLAKSIAQEMQLSEDDVDAIEMAGLVHDIGKLSVPAEILTKPGSLSDNEFALIKEHSETGYTILKGVDFPWPVADIVLAHHERRDGSGYPYGLKGDDIPFASRVLAVADVVEAMASHRPYRPALGLDVAVAELTGHLEKYDPGVVSALLALYESGRVDLRPVA
jgi:putative nucleotidyltransferase with HDIG domain/PAS domain S-box-containing protein